MELHPLAKAHRAAINEQIKLIEQMKAANYKIKEIEYETARLGVFKTKLNLWIINSKIKRGVKRKKLKKVA